MRHTIFLLLSIFLLNNDLNAQVTVARDIKKADNIFPLITASNISSIYIDKNDEEAVKKVSKLFVNDIKLVTDKDINITNNPKNLAPYIVIAGTIGKNQLLDKLIKEKRINVSDIKGDWERYSIQIIDNPFPNVKKALIVAGSDRRGTAYGLFSISEAIGVHPWYWWADVPVKKQQSIALKVSPFTAKSPTVKYRGIFINDEDWGLLPWAKNTFDPQFKDIGPRTYAKVYELLLRLKANYLAPAMHEATGAFNKYPENKLLADTFGIVMGSVHSEPLLFNNASEWDKKTLGEWNYKTNKENILKVLNKRVSENAPFENVYSLALRGLHDRAMEGDLSMNQRVKQLEQAIIDQRTILDKNIDKPIETVPQVFTPYKEVLDIYSNGLDLPDDVTIIWPDDNYGYMKRLSGPSEQKRAGRSGVYYHVSYLGSPHDYLWLSSTPPSLMFEELKKAYDTGADRVWLLNVGDIKSSEFPTTLFLSMAYDITKFNFDNIHSYQAQWLSSIYGEKYFDDLYNITTNYYHLAFSRKPEFMGWGYEWNTYKHARERKTDTDFSFANYNEAENRLSTYKTIGNLSSKILGELDETLKPSFYQLLYYPVKGAELMNKMTLNGQKNRWYASQGRSETNSLKNQVIQYRDSLKLITQGYNSLLNGKWNRVMSMVQGVTASYFETPRLDTISIPQNSQMGVFAEGEDVQIGSKAFHSLPGFNTYTKKSYFIDVYNKGSQQLNWNLKTSDDWILVDKEKGSAKFGDRIWVSIDWSKVPSGDKILGEIELSGHGKKEKVFVSVFNPTSPTIEDLDGLFIEDNGYISIGGADFHRKTENDDIKIEIINNLGFENRSALLGDPTAPMQNPKSSIAPSLEYDFYSNHFGSVDVYTYVLPVFPLNSDRDSGQHEASNQQTKYGVCINDGPISTPSSSAPEYTQVWSENVLRNAAINKSVLHINKAGKNTLKIISADPGMVIQKIVIDFGGMKRSYLGPPTTQVKVNDTDKTLK